ncbi:MAG: recombinase A [Armatimonadetes bacterium]|nr:recombinase A [Armatimonadota bacterium]
MSLRLPVRARLPEPEAAPAWGYAQLAGRLAELSAAADSAVLTLAFSLALDAQRDAEPVAWITSPKGAFFPPDAAQAGIDLGAFVVVRVPDLLGMARAADQLVRSGGFGLVILDLISLTDVRRPQLSTASQTRLAGLAQKHAAAVLVLTEKSAESPSQGSLVSLRAEARRTQWGPCLVEVRVLKDKRRGPGQIHVEACHAPPGLH